MHARAQMIARRPAPGLSVATSIFAAAWLHRGAHVLSVAVLVVTAVLAAPALASAAGSVRLAWEASPEADVTGYVVSYRSEDAASSGAVNVGKQTAAQVDNLRSGMRYFFSVFSYNAAGLRSVPSSEVSGIVDGPADPTTPTGGTPLPATHQTYFAEGATGVYDYRLALVNTNDSPSAVNVSFLREGSTPVARNYTVGAHARLSIDARDVAELVSTPQAFGAIVAAAPGVVAERTMSWNQGGMASGAHTAKALEAAGTTWYLAEGAAGFYDTFILIANPGGSDANVTADFLREDGQVVSHAYPVKANGRYTIVTQDVPELKGHTFGVTLHSSQPVLVERSMYFKFASGFYWEGHASSAVPDANTHWFLAEGHSGAFFATFVLLSNPNNYDVDATIRYLTDDGLARTETRTIAKTSRETIVVNAVPQLNARAVSFDISATGPIIAERSMYWPGSPGPWYGAHNSTGMTSLGTKWALAEGEFGGPNAAETYVLLVNPGTVTANVTLSYYREGGLTPVSVTKAVEPGKRLTVSAGGLRTSDGSAALASGERFGVQVTSDQPIAVERSIYSSPNGIFWKNGTNETGTKLQ
jgi:hypothetical protein